MKSWKSTSACALCLLVSGLAACGDDTSDGAGGGGGGAGGDDTNTASSTTTSSATGGGIADCADLGARASERGTALGCATDVGADFQSECETLYTGLPACGAEVDALIACMLAVPDSDWVCVTDSVSLPDGTCETEVQAMTLCSAG